MAETRTPAGAEEAGDRWRWRCYYCLAAAVVFLLFSLVNLFWFMVVVSLSCSRMATAEFGWQRGYLDRAAEDQGERP